MGESAPEEWKNMWGAKVKWPADMPDDLLQYSVQTVTEALDACADWDSKGEEVLAQLKKQFDTKWGPYWHIVVGKNFGSFVTHETRRFIYFYAGDKAVLVFKAGV